MIKCGQLYKILQKTKFAKFILILDIYRYAVKGKMKNKETLF